MSPKNRFFLYLLFLGAFLITAPALVFYTAGYRLNVKTGRLLETGVLSVESLPKGASVLVNEKNTKKQTPLILDNLQENTYTVRLMRPGFFPWEKSVHIIPRRTQFISTAHLFSNQPPVVTVGSIEKKASAFSPDPSLALDQNPHHTTLSRRTGSAFSIIAQLPRGEYTFEPSPVGILLFDAKRERIIFVDEHNSEPIRLIDHATQWQWNPTNDQLLYTDDFELQVHNIRTQKTTTLTRVSRPIQSIAWYPDGQVAFYAQSTQIVAVELNEDHGTRVFTTLVSGNLIEDLHIDTKGKVLQFTDQKENEREYFVKTL